MPVKRFRAQNFRCLEDVEFEADPQYNLIFGANASGKTSLLEALAYLGRGKSFRGVPAANLIRQGADEFLLVGIVERRGQASTVGVRNSREGLEVRVDGETGGGSAILAEFLPLQIIEPDIHLLVSGGPDVRRRYLDWVAFHVEHDYLPAWRQFRRALKQRNAALRAGGNGLEAWNAEFVELGIRVDDARRHALGLCLAGLENQAACLLGEEIRFEYRPGWSADYDLAEALSSSAERDLALGTTQVGPHRADLRLMVSERQARRLVSRGQQKLLASAMVLAATELVQVHQGRPMLLLLDDPAAELDQNSLEKLMNQVYSLGSQLIATSLEPDVLDFPGDPVVFHVEQGRLSRL